jgi:ABC-2 type transport system ATP-binding protein
MILKTENLTKIYGNRTVLNSLSININNGNVYGLLGPNGSGKTTTLSIILGIVNQNSGIYSWFDETSNENAKKRIGALIEIPRFYPYLSLEKNLKIVTSIKEIPETDISRVLDIVKLENRRKSRFDTLSLGMKQRLALASTLLGDAVVLVLDEPTNGLDPEGIADFRNIIKYETSKGKTIIIASHILDEIEKVCSHVAILKLGNLIANGKVSDLLKAEESIIISTQKLSEFNELLVRSGITKKIIQKDFELELFLNSNVTTLNLNELAVKNGFILSKLEVKKQSLENQFLEIVK